MLLALMTLCALDSTQVVRIAVAEGEELSVTLTGTGPDVVMLPGLFGSSFSYRQVVAKLDSAGFRSIGIELLGMGSSSRPRGADYSLAAQADRVDAVLDSLGVEHAVLVGHSIGASVAMRLAYRHAGRVRGIVSVEGGPTEAASTNGFSRLMRFAPALRMSGALRGLPALIRREMKNVSLDDKWISPSIIAGYTAGLMENLDQTMDAFQGMARAEEPDAIIEHLRAIDCPVLLLVSERSHKSGPSDEEVLTLVERLASFNVDTIPGTGYFIQEEQPHALVEAIIRMGQVPASSN